MANCKEVSKRRCACLEDSATQRTRLVYFATCNRADGDRQSVTEIQDYCSWAAPRSLTQAGRYDDLRYGKTCMLQLTGKRELQSSGSTLCHMSRY